MCILSHCKSGSNLIATGVQINETAATNAEFGPPSSNRSLNEQCWHGIRYSDRYYYIDTLKFLARHSLSESALNLFRRHSKHLDVRAHGEMVFPKQGQPYQLNLFPWRFRIELQLPDEIALKALAAQSQLKLTRVELATDFTFDDEQGKYRMLDYFEEHFVHPRQRHNLRKSFDNGGMSTGRRKRGHYFTGYCSLPCRIDGVLDCFHFEARHLGAEDLARIGLRETRDLLAFDHVRYWQKIDRNFLHVDKERFGRFYENRRTGRRRRVSDQAPFLGRSRDFAIGALLYRLDAVDKTGKRTVQQFIKKYGRGPFVTEYPLK